ncbi:interleukin-23 receptor isoform X2 [Eleutherodactylus coqui]|uniref:interleukin-23 receptor isoform X2 n=1 Tax=Eleutherodactylus coqui TaxID=57060 RepID=UPI0034627B51
MTCKWDRGRSTGLPTDYTVHLMNLQTGKNTTVSTTEAVVSFPLDMTQNEVQQIQILAENQLNQSESEVVKFQLADIVVPPTPAITKINISGTNLMIYINWRNQTSESQRYCEVAYKTPKELRWELAGKEMNINNTVSLKNICNADSLRVRCREEIGKGYWSAWSNLHQMPPSAPEVWRLLGRQLPGGVQEVIILIASDPDDSPRINVSGYEVYYYNEGVRTGVKQCPSSGLQCVALVPKEVQTVSVAAYNPYGFSPASHLPIQEGDASGPQNVAVQSVPPTSMSVQWQPPVSSAEPIGYVLQWTSNSCDGKPRDVSWQKTEKEQTNFTIKDNIPPGHRITISLYAVYRTGVSGPSTVYGYSQELKPKTGPSSIKILATSLNERRIEWTEIPLCDRGGFITRYTVYITRQYQTESKFKYEVAGSTTHLLFDKFNPDEQYSVCISASTRAGEGPDDHCTNFHQDNDLNGYIGLLVGMAFGVLVFSAIIMTLSRIRRRVKKGLILLLPKCLYEEYPHVGRSPAVKSLQQAAQENLEPLVSLLPNDPEIVELEVLLKEETSHPISSTDPAQEIATMMKVDEPLTPTVDIEVSEHTLGYRPQTANFTSQEHNSYFSHSHMLDLQRTTVAPGNPVIPINNMFLSNTTDDIFKQMNLMVTSDVNLDDEPLQSTTDLTLQSLWENQTFIDRLVMPVVPGDQVICTPTLEEFDDTKSYFPQIFTGGL